MAELLSRFRVAITILLATSVALILVSTVAPSHAGISDRAREPVVISFSVDQFPRWVDQSISADVFELWAYHDDGQQGVWKEVPYQIDQLKPGDPDALPQYLDEDLPGTDCDGDGATGEICGDPFDTHLQFPCEQTYFLRGTAEPTEPLRTDDELVFLAGRSGACDAPLDGWPSSGLTIYRHRIFVADGDTADCQDPDTECGCVYLFRRTAGQRPHDEDLIDYVLTDDATHWPDGTCRPTDGACGSIVGDPADVDGDGAKDIAAYRWDFLGDWTMGHLEVSDTSWDDTSAHSSPATHDPSRDIVDRLKWRIDSPHETESNWDLFDVGGCAVWRGYIDGPVRVIRLIQGAASGGTTTKYEYAYPGEIHEQVYLRVHPVDGPIFSYVDLLEENVSPDATADPDEQPATDTVAYVYEEREDNGELETYMLDKVNGVPAVDTSAFNFGDWHQVSTKLGSILFRKGAVDFPQGVESSYKYVDTDEKTWTDGAQGIEREVETGDFGATQWRFSNPLPDTQSCSCVHQNADKMVALLERSYVILSSGEAGSGSGDEEDDDRTSEFSVSVEEEKFESDPDPPDPPVEPCKPELGSQYGDDGGDPELHAELSPCTNATGWNLYRSQGAGVTERLASLPPGAVYRERTLALGAEATYYAAALGPGGTEGEFSEPVTIQHIDTVAPEPAIDVQAEAAPGTITVSWLQPQDPGLAAYKIRVATTSGGPYTVAAEGAQLRSSNRVERTFVASGGQTYYVVVVLRDHAGNEGAPSVEVPVEVP